MELFNGMFGRVGKDMCRLGVNGELAIKTGGRNGAPVVYKTFNVKSNALLNCDQFAYDVGAEWFFIIPTNKVERGDIIFVNGTPRCVMEVRDNKIETLSYEDGSVLTIIPERHIFMGKQYFYGKLVSLFGNMMNGKGGANNFMKYMMMSEMMKGNNANGNGTGMGNMLPMMMMMNTMGGNGGGFNLFEGLFDEDEVAEPEPEKEKEEK